ncbi:MAG TPA: DUF1707 domain-containing protein [Mycobacteriales bacterium]|jgi:hypothetical protein|nr:DUF1707 domain-containing protein [Mycobacteriales bacterium]
MSTETANVTANEVRASDAERERVAALLQQAGAEGRLTIAEVDERVAAAYAATYRRELPPLTRDLPTDDTTRETARRPVPGPLRYDRGLRIHAVIATVLSVILISRWAGTGLGFFWPIFPMFWLWGSLAVRMAFRRAGGWDARRPGGWDGRRGPRWAGR